MLSPEPAFSNIYAAGQDTISRAAPLVIAGSSAYPPFSFLNEDEKPDGFDVDIIKALMEKIGYKNNYSITLASWPELTSDFIKGKIDILIGVTHTKKILKSGYFTIPYSRIKHCFATRKKDNINTLNDLKGKEVMIRKGGWYDFYLSENPPIFKIFYVKDVECGLKMLEKGEHDAVLSSNMVINYFLDKNGTRSIKIHKSGLESTAYSITINASRKEMLDKINSGLEEMHYEGTYDKIINKWFGFFKRAKNRKILFIIVFLMLLLASILLLFIYFSRKRIRKVILQLKNFRQEAEIAMSAGKVFAWSYDVNNGVLRRINIKKGEEEKHKAKQSLKEEMRDMVEKDRKIFSGIMSDLIKGKSSSSFMEFKKNDGKGGFLHYEANIKRIEKSRYQHLRIIGTVKEVTERKNMLNQLDLYRKRIKFINATSDFVLFQYNVSEQIFYLLEESGEVDSKKYRSEEYLETVFPSDMKTARIFFENMNKGLQKTIDTELRVKDNLHKQDKESSSGEIFHWNAVHAEAYEYDKDNRILTYLGIIRNNNQWKKMNEKLVKLRDEAEEANRNKTDFLANISHEIRTPLNSIVGFSNLLKQTVSKKEKKQFIEIIKKNNEALLQLINVILELAKIDAGSYKINYTYFQILPLIQKTISAYDKLLKEGVSIRCNCTDNTEIYSDKDKLTLILKNLIANAVKFTQKGHIDIYYEFNMGKMTLSVSDTGIGIPKEYKKKIFERFEKFDSFAQGTGLGLSLCKSIATTLGGKIGFESEAGTGTRFWLVIPYIKEKL
jgi:signal transduction histidine kinase/ABC-type amino acid transport substrate-binding protein